jgi:hypothetical protein
MGKYDGRRKEKEAKLKYREARLESQNQEYRVKLKDCRESEGNLKKSFEEERQLYQEKIESLKRKIVNAEYLSHSGHFDEGAHGYRNEYPGVQIRDFGTFYGQADMDYIGDMQQVGSTSPVGRTSSTYRHSHPEAKGSQDTRKLSRTPMIPDPEELLIRTEESPRRPSHRRSHTITNDWDAAFGTSSPPARPGATQNSHLKRPVRAFMSPRPTMITISHQRTEKPDELQRRNNRVHHRQAPSRSRTTHKVTTDLDIPSLQNRTTSTGKREALSPDRIAAATARLKQKEESRRKGEGKENMREVFI